MQRTKSIFNTFRQKTNIIIYGTNTASGRFFDLVLLGVILVSIVIVMLETVKGIDTKYHNELIVLEWVITIFFTIEYILRVMRGPMQALEALTENDPPIESICEELIQN